MTTSVDGWQFMKAEDAVSGKEGALYATIGTDTIQVAECKKIDIKFTKNKTEFKSLGNRATQHKATGWTGTGSLTLHYATSIFAKMMIEYADSGKDAYFTLQVINDDPTSGVGRQTINLYDVNLDDLDISRLDADGGFLEQASNFTFSDISMTDEFGKTE